MAVSQEVTSMVRGWLRASPSAGRCKLPTTCALVIPRPERLGLGAKLPDEGTLEASNKSTLASVIGKKLARRKRRRDWEEQGKPGEDCQAEPGRDAKVASSSDEECSRSVAISSAKRLAERQPKGIGSFGRKRRKRKKKKLRKEEELEMSSSSAFPDAVLNLKQSKQSTTETIETRVNAVHSQSPVKGALEMSVAVEDTSKHGRQVETVGLPAQDKPPRTKDLHLDGSRKLRKRRLEQVKVLRTRKLTKGRCRKKTERKQSDRTDAKAGKTPAATKLTEAVIPAVELRDAAKPSESERRGETARATGVIHKRKKKPGKTEKPQDSQQRHSLDAAESCNATDNTDMSAPPSFSETQSTSAAVVSQSSATSRIRTVEHKTTHSKLLRRQRKLKRLRRGKCCL